MRDRIPTKVLDNGAIRYAVYDENGALLRYEYMLPADEPTDPGTTLRKGTLLDDDAEAKIWGAAADRTVNDGFHKVSEFYQHWWSIHGDETTYVQSPDRNAYPDSGTVDGLTYTYLGVPFENARDGQRVENGSYVGTGTKGEDNPCRLSFTKKPVFVVISCYKDNGVMGFFMRDSNRAACFKPAGTSSGSANAWYMPCSWGDDYLEWYTTATTNGPLLQLNHAPNAGSPYEYDYIAFFE